MHIFGNPPEFKLRFVGLNKACKGRVSLTFNQEKFEISLSWVFIKGKPTNSRNILEIFHKKSDNPEISQIFLETGTNPDFSGLNHFKVSLVKTTFLIFFPDHSWFLLVEFWRASVHDK